MRISQRNLEADLPHCVRNVEEKNVLLFVAISSLVLELLTLRLLMSYIYIYIYTYIYIYGAPILDVSRSHTTTQHSQ